MKLTVCTGWSPAGYEQYGRRFAESFHRYVDPAVDLVVYGETPVKLPRGAFRTLREIPGCWEFLQRHDTPVARGQVPTEATRKHWKPSHIEAGYSFRFDAWKFCRQGFIPDHAAMILAQRTPADQLLAWFDGDVVFHAPITAAALAGLLPPGKDVAYLGRGAKHSEIGFQLYRIPAALPMLAAFRETYSTDAVFDLKEWHSAFVFDHARRTTGARGHDLTPGGYGHVWHQSPLRAFSDHLKGDKRKIKGKSDERTR
jgi:hypothetical protein